MTVLSTFHVTAFVQTSFTSSHRSALCKLSAMKQPVGPLARLKKASDPDDYNRVVEEKMKKTGMSREEAEADYNAFLENPPFYYALEKKEEYYKSLGYKDIFEGMIGEAEKEGKGDEMRERLNKFRLQSKIKAAAVLVVAILGLFYIQTIYNADPEHFLKGGLPDYSRR
ncbi:hypothetical protein CTEN210_01591 [Chaetoceros tenuissimus]|uniref:Uncharacterized protein n=1 Tax=Chaetoceros tenuissimus TaxID=426638 RepID=A0AAD3CFF0_9STRA|nr:hypothetical protein CTEN210_01591 [Chaetoceros tenuissimus]